MRAISGVLGFVTRFWFLIVVAAILVGAGIAIGLQGFPAWPYLIALLGIVMRTLYGLALNCLEAAKNSGEWPMFEDRYYISLLAAITVDVLLMGMYLMTNEGVLVELSTAGFVLAFLFGYGGANFVRDNEKAAKAVAVVLKRP